MATAQETVVRFRSRYGAYQINIPTDSEDYDVLRTHYRKGTLDFIPEPETKQGILVVHDKKVAQAVRKVIMKVDSVNAWEDMSAMPMRCNVPDCEFSLPDSGSEAQAEMYQHLLSEHADVLLGKPAKTKAVKEPKEEEASGEVPEEAEPEAEEAEGTTQKAGKGTAKSGDKVS